MTSRPYSPYWLRLTLYAFFCLAACLILAARACRAAPRLARRLAGATLLLFCEPRSEKLDGPLYTLCNS